MFALDADFVVSANLHEKLSAPEAAAALLEDVSIQHNVIVLPAFETEISLGLERGSEVATKAQQGEPPLLHAVSIEPPDSSSCIAVL